MNSYEILVLSHTNKDSQYISEYFCKTFVSEITKVINSRREVYLGDYYIRFVTYDGYHRKYRHGFRGLTITDYLLETSIDKYKKEKNV